MYSRDWSSDVCSSDLTHDYLSADINQKNHNPSDPRTTKKRKVLDSKSRPKYDSALKMPVIKSDTFNFNLPHPYLPRHKNLCMRFLNLLNLNQPHPQRNLKGLR